MEGDVNFKKIFLITMIVSLSISALLGIIIFLSGDFGDTQTKILLTTLAIGGFSLTSLCCATLYDKQRFPTFAVIGIVVSVLAFLYATGIIWEIIRFDFLSGDGNVIKTFFTLIIFSIAIAHASLLLLIKSDKTSVNVSLSLTLLFISLLVLELLYIVWGEVGARDSDFTYRILGVFAILDVLGTIVTPILHKVTSMHEEN